MPAVTVRDLNLWITISQPPLHQYYALKSGALLDPEGPFDGIFESGHG